MKNTFLCSGYALFDNLALGDIPGDPAEPKPFRLFAVGENSLTRNGKACTLTLDAEDIAAIAGCQAGDVVESFCFAGETSITSRGVSGR